MPAGFLLLPDASDRSFARLQRKVRLLALRRLLSHPLDGLPAPLGAALANLRRILVPMARRRTGALLSTIALPDVIARLLVLERGLGAADALLAGAATDLIAALPPSALSEAILWEHPVPAIAAPTRGVAVSFTPAATAMLADPSGVSFALANGQKWALGAPPPPGVTVTAAYHRLHPQLARLHLATVDTNPLSMDEEHPDKSGNAIDLGGRPVADWTAALGEALALIAQTLPEWWQELSVSAERLIPVGYAPEMHLSASYQEAPGVAYLTLHPSVLTLAEAVIHEIQHSRLNTLMWLDPTLENGRSTWTRSPVRPDLRPLSGVLLAVHAFTPVAAMHQRMMAMNHPLAEGPHFQRRRREVWENNDRGLAVLLEQGRPTKVGQRLLKDMQRLHQETCEQSDQLTQ